jgi:Flp pilus assembly secretin CpaC
MFARVSIRSGLHGAALVLALSSSGASAREGVRTIPLAAVSTTDDRNLADTRPIAPETMRPSKQTPQGELSVTVNRAKVIKLPEKTQTVVIGNPAVADIAIQKSGVVVLTGKSFGVTNFLALDASGSMIGESMVSVTAPTEATLTVQRGLERQTYSCTPVCHPSVALGDANGFFSETKGQVEQHSAFVTSR